MTIAVNAAPISVPGQPNKEVMAAMVAEVSPATIISVRPTMGVVEPVGCCADAVWLWLIPALYYSYP